MGHRKKRSLTPVDKTPNIEADIEVSDAVNEAEERFFDNRDVAPLDNSAILYTRLKYKVAPHVNDDYSDYYELFDLESGDYIGIIPRIRLEDTWQKASTATNRPHISKAQWKNICDALADYARENVDDCHDEVLVQDVWRIHELDFFSMFFDRATQFIELLDCAIKQDIAESESLMARWDSIKNYRYKVTLNGEGAPKSYGDGLFVADDCARLEAAGIHYLNDIRKVDIYYIKNTYIKYDAIKSLPEDINAAFKEDYERRKDKLFKVLPMVTGFIAMAVTIVLSYLYQYTLIKNKPMTLVIIIALALWLYSVCTIVWGAIRAVRRRKKRPRYFYFTRGITGLTVMFAIVSTFAICSASWFYERFDGYDDTFYYRNVEDGKIEVAGLVDKELTIIDIPEEIDGKQVTGIGWLAFSYEDVTEININHDNVDYIDFAAFYNCTQLEKVNNTQNVQKIGYAAFMNCDGLIKLSLPSVTDIDAYAFRNCENLAELNDISDLNSIGKGAFRNCKALGSLIVEDASDITIINDSTFQNCESLTQTNVYYNATHIGAKAFKGCSGLTEIVINDEADFIGSAAFEDCSSLESLTVPFVGKKRGKYKAFSYCMDNNSSLRTLRISAGGELKKKAFMGLYSLEYIVIDGDITSISNNAFEGCTRLKEVRLSDSIVSIGDYAFKNCEQLSSVDGIDNIDSLGKGAFEGCKALVSMDLSNVTSLGDGCFADCVNLADIKFNDSGDLTYIADNSFKGCTALVGVDMPDSVTSIGAGSFSGSDLVSFTFGDNISSIGNSAFENCKDLTSADLKSLNASVGKAAFKGCSSLANATLPDVMDNIPESIFENCTALTSFDMSSNVKKINANAFAGSGLVSIDIVDGVNEISKKAFNDCDSLEQVVIPNSVKTIRVNAFAECDNLYGFTTPFLGKSRTLYTNGYSHIFGSASRGARDITLTDTTTVRRTMFGGGTDRIWNITIEGATKVKARAFKNFEQLKSIYIPDTVEKLGQDAFRGCDSLVSVHLPDNAGVNQLKANTFRNCYMLENVTGGAYITALGKRTFSGCGHLTEVNMPALEKIGERCFEDCSAITEFAETPNLRSVGKLAFDGCSDLKSFVIPESMPVIGKQAFAGSGLRSVSLPDNLTELKDSAFESCKLTGIDLSGYVSLKFGKNVFRDCAELSYAELPASLDVIPNGVFRGCIALSHFNINSNVKKIDSFAFAQSGLASIDVPDGVTEIGKRAFYECNSLVSIRLSDNLKTIRLEAFGDCMNLRTAVVPFLGKSRAIVGYGYRHTFGSSANITGVKVTDMKKICSGAFHGAKHVLEYVELENVEKIGANAFKGFSALKDVRVTDTLRKIGANAFRNCTSLEYIEMPDTVTQIGHDMARGASKLSSVRLSQSLKTIPYNAFMKTALVSVEIPDSVKVIRKQAFRECEALTSVHFGDSLETIGIRAFRGCRSLSYIGFNNSLKTIKKSAFRGCSTLVSMVLPESVQRINSYAFRDCSQLAEVRIPDSVKHIGRKILHECDNVKILVIPFIGSTPSMTYNMEMVFGLYGHPSLEYLEITNAKKLKKGFLDGYHVGTLRLHSGIKNFNSETLSDGTIALVEIPEGSSYRGDIGYYGSRVQTYSE